jgi:hypothetical protein
MERIALTTQHLTAATVARLDADLAAAIAKVSSGEAAKAGASLTFAVREDEEEGLVVDYVHKSAIAQKGSWVVDSQPRLPLEDEEEVELLRGSRAAVPGGDR